LIAVEDLNVKGLAGGVLAKSVHDAAGSAFRAKLSCKAKNADRQPVKRQPAWNRTTMPAQGSSTEETLRSEARMLNVGSAQPATRCRHWEY